MGLSVMQRILELMTKKLDKIATKVEPIIVDKVNIRCLECASTDLAVIKVTKTDKIWNRILKCKNCSAKNKQVLNIVDVESAPDTYTFVFKPGSQTVISFRNNIPEVKEEVMHKVLKGDKEGLVIKSFRKLLIKQINKVVQNKHKEGFFKKFRNRSKPYFLRDVTYLKGSPWVYAGFKLLIPELEEPNGRNFKLISLCDVVWIKMLECEQITLFVKKVIIQYTNKEVS